MKKVSAGIIALCIKAGPKIFSVFAKMLKGVKVGKVGLAGASTATYAYMFTWEFALMIMLLLFVHESGHIWAMKRCGMKTKGIYFIPFIGAAAVTDGEFPSRRATVFIALMGPLWGFALSGIAALVYFATENPLFAAAASWMALINLFNLLPISPLDGGRVLSAIAFSVHSWLGFIFLSIGIIASAVIAIYLGLSLFWVLLIIGVLELIFEYRKYRKAERAPSRLRYCKRCENPEKQECPPFKYGYKFRKEDDDPVVLAPMSSLWILASAAAYLLTAAVLYIIMAGTAHIPGADSAMEILVG